VSFLLHDSSQAQGLRLTCIFSCLLLPLSAQIAVPELSLQAHTGAGESFLTEIAVYMLVSRTGSCHQSYNFEMVCES